jgi:hypothetical protein
MIILDSLGKKLVSVTVAGVLLLSFGLLAIVVPETRITLVPQKKVFKETYEFTLKIGIQEPLLPLNILPGFVPPYQEGSKRDTFLAIQRLPYAVEKSHLAEFMTRKVAATIAQDEKINEESLRYSLTALDPAKQRVKVTVETDVSKIYDHEAIKQMVRGKRKTAALAALHGLPGIKSAEIKTTPSWAPLLPFIKERIVIIEK